MRRSVPDDGVQARVRELRGSVVVVHKVDPARHGAPDLPAHWQRPQLLAAHTGQVPAPVTRNQTESSASSNNPWQQFNFQASRLLHV